MDNETEVTPVIFRRWRSKENGRGVIAIFPYDIVDNKNNVQMYEHVGQHGGGSHGVIKATRPVKIDEKDVEDLHRELLMRGYTLKVITRWPSWRAVKAAAAKSR